MNKLKQSTILLAVMLMASVNMSAQTLGLEQASENFWDEVKGSAKFILAGIFLISIIFNIGKIIGNDRDYKGFFAGVGMFFFGLILVVAVIGYILSLNFG